MNIYITADNERQLRDFQASTGKSMSGLLNDLLYYFFEGKTNLSIKSKFTVELKKPEELQKIIDKATNQIAIDAQPVPDETPTTHYAEGSQPFISLKEQNQREIDEAINAKQD